MWGCMLVGTNFIELESRFWNMLVSCVLLVWIIGIGSIVMCVPVSSMVCCSVVTMDAST